MMQKDAKVLLGFSLAWYSQSGETYLTVRLKTRSFFFLLLFGLGQAGRFHSNASMLACFCLGSRRCTCVTSDTFMLPLGGGICGFRRQNMLRTLELGWAVLSCPFLVSSRLSGLVWSPCFLAPHQQICTRRKDIAHQAGKKKAGSRQASRKSATVIYLSQAGAARIASK